MNRHSAHSKEVATFLSLRPSMAGQTGHFIVSLGDHTGSLLVKQTEEEGYNTRPHSPSHTPGKFRLRL